MTRVAAIIGWTFLAAVLVGACVPGMEYHVYFGTTEGALQWHQKLSTPKKNSP